MSIQQALNYNDIRETCILQLDKTASTWFLLKNFISWQMYI